MGFEPTTLCDLAGCSSHWGGFNFSKLVSFLHLKFLLIPPLKNIIIVSLIFFTV